MVFTTNQLNMRITMIVTSTYEIFQANNTKFYVNLGQFCDIIGEEEWLHGEVNCLCNIALSRIISLSWGAKKKESKNSPNSCLCVGDLVTVENHGKHWIQLAEIHSIDYSTKLAIAKWDVTQKKDTANLGDCKKYDETDVSHRKCKSTEFYFYMTDKKSKVNKKSDELLNPPMGQKKTCSTWKKTHPSYVLKVLLET
jgi:hypothetical protein